VERIWFPGSKNAPIDAAKPSSNQALGHGLAERDMSPPRPRDLADDYYGELAAHPDPARAVGWESRAAATCRYVAACAELRPGDEVLELGAGLGDFGRFLAERSLAVAYRGLERDPRLITRAHAMAPPVNLELGDLFSAAPRSADLVVAIGALVDGGPLRSDGVRFTRLRRLIEVARGAARRHAVLILLDQDLLERDPIRSCEPALGGIRPAEVPWLAPDAQVTRPLPTDLCLVLPAT
jgi:hypothetical protein